MEKVRNLVKNFSLSFRIFLGKGKFSKVKNFQRNYLDIESRKFFTKFSYFFESENISLNFHIRRNLKVKIFKEILKVM